MAVSIDYRERVPKGYSPSFVRRLSGTLTNAEALALRATPKTLVAAPGATFINVFERLDIAFDRTAVYAESTANLVVRYTGTTGVVASQIGEATGFADAAADAYMSVLAADSPLQTVNAALVLHNNGAGEWTGGNAANVFYWTVFYRIIKSPF
jgi:hypothetical protein